MSTTKNIETPEKLLELFEAYKEETKSKPIKKMDFKGKDADMVYYELERPLTMVGFENYLFKKGIISTLKHYMCNLDDRYKDYVTICSYVKGEIRQDQVEGGMAGIYNPSITQRLNNLVDRADVTTDGEKIQKSIPLVLSDGRSYDDLKDELKPE